MTTPTLTPSVAQRLLNYLHSRQGEMVDLLKCLVLAESPSTVPKAQKQVLSLLKNALLSRHCWVRQGATQKCRIDLKSVKATGDRGFGEKLMWAVRSVRLRSDENTTQSRRSLKTGKSWGGLEAKRQRKDREKTKNRRRKGIKSIKRRKWGLLLFN